MILKWLPLSIGIHVLSCTEKMFISCQERVVSLKKPTKGRAIVLYLKASCLGSFNLFLFMVIIFILLRVLFHFLTDFFFYFTF